MLARLVINDVVLIEKLTVAFAPGLNVFTGETGAGKSMLLDALSLALGERSDAALVRAGASQASVAAEFDLPEKHVLFAVAEEQGLAVENPVILRRVVGKDGKTRAFFNDQPISVGLLKQFGERLLEIHGQFEAHGLLNASTHRGFLDSFADGSELRKKTAKAFQSWKASVEQASKAKAENEQARAEEDFLRASVNELEDLAPQACEADTLAAERTQLQHREKILEALNAAASWLDGDRGALVSLSHAGKAVSRVSDKAAALPEILASIDRASNDASEASQQLARFLSALDTRPDALQTVEERLFALRAAARKHNTQVEKLSEVLSNLKARLALLIDGGDAVEKLMKQANEARKAYEDCAEALSAKRRAAAQKLEKEVNKELPPLKLERAKFLVAVTALPEEQWGEEGVDKVVFLAATNTGAAAGPLQKIASGGELARFMLALKTVLASADPVPVLVFDEVDAGIGGAVASAVGERLLQLASDVQVLVVTHSPQVAARGGHHMRVSKSDAMKTTITKVEVLDGPARREEIARMLSGSKVTDAARQAADSLLFDAPSAVSKPKTKRKA